MEQNNYLEFEKSKAAVYMIMEACFQDVFDSFYCGTFS